MFQSVNDNFISQFSHGTVCTNKFNYLGPPKITEGGPFDPHWPISKINPAFCLPVPTLVLQSAPPPQVCYFPHTSFSVLMQALLSLWTSLFGFALGSFFSKLLPLSSHSCPLLLLSWFPLLLSFLSFVVLGGQLHPHLHVTWLFFLQFPCSHLFTSVIFTPLFPKFHLLSLLSSSLTKSPPFCSSTKSTLSSCSQLLNLLYCALVL